MRMHADEVETDTGLVRRRIAAQFPQWASLPVRPVASARTDNALYRLGDALVVRLPRIEGAVQSVDTDHRWLPRLAPLLPVSIPEPLGRGAPGEGYPWPWSVLRWLDGENPAVGQLVDPGRLARELAEFVDALRRIDPADGPRAGRSGPLAPRDTATRDAIKSLHGMLDAQAVSAAWDAALQVPEWDGPPVWLHTDLAPGNILVADGRLSGVVDWAGVGIGDPACDLPVAWNLLPSDVRDVFRGTLGVDDATWARGRGWALSIALIQLPYYQNTNPPLAANARHVVREVLAEHEHRRSER
jgi:aminoglycoside phosphotransferase (APT) family kinase protein